MAGVGMKKEAIENCFASAIKRRAVPVSLVPLRFCASPSKTQTSLAPRLVLPCDDGVVLPCGGVDLPCEPGGPGTLVLDP